ncbi:hypothetical protein NHX12_001481, partial [Muraenolepis orangiensis]
RKYPKVDQPRGPWGPHEVRGYHHRGFQRPFNFRGRGRGFFPRGRFQRGGGGGGGEDNLHGDSSTIPAAFRKFLEEQRNGSELDQGKVLKAGGQVAGGGKVAEEGVSNGTTSDCASNLPPMPALRRRVGDLRGDESSKAKAKTSALAVFEERLGRWKSSGHRPLADRPDLTQAHSGAQRPESADAADAAKLPGFSPEKDSGRFQRTEKQAKCSVMMDFLRDRMSSSSDVLTGERQLSQDLVQSCRKEQEFRSIFQHVDTSRVQRSPSELFTQHILTIVHHVNAQYFPTSGGSLSERFATYQRRIHRRIDVSPSAFKKHSHLFEAMKSSEEGSYKDGGEKAMKGDSSDLRLDIESRKKISVGEQDCDQDKERGLGDPPVPSKERSKEKSHKRHKKSNRSGDQDFSKARPAQRDVPEPTETGRPREGFQFTVRGRGWNRGNHHGNGVHGNPSAAATQNEDWEPEFTPKSKKYYLHDNNREGERERERRWAGGRGSAGRGGGFTDGRPRFIIRRAVAGGDGGNHFQVNGKQKVNEAEEEGRQHVCDA